MSGKSSVLRLCTSTLPCLGILSLALALCQATLNPAFILTSTPEQVKRGITKDVTLRCKHNGRTRSQLSKVNAIQLRRKDGSNWNLLAEKKASNVPETVDNHASVSGETGGGIQSIFLAISWPIATENTMGVFRCDVIGVDMNEEKVMESSLLHEITDIYITDIMDLLLKTQTELRTDIKDIRTRQKLSNKKLDDKINVWANDMESLVQEVDHLKKKIDSVSEEVELVETNLLGFWPGGFYAFLQSTAGCPQSSLSLSGNESYYKIHTESSEKRSKNKDNVSHVLPARTSSKEGDKNFITMRFCESDDEPNSAHWPDGAYCINKIHDKSCPPGLEEGTVELDGEDIANADQHAGNVVYTSARHFPQIGFCCMTSGDPGVPVILPTQSPFLLYRRGDSCQQVLHMNFSESTLDIDTEDSDNGDRYEGVVPDMNINKNSKTTFHLCYYM